MYRTRTYLAGDWDGDSSMIGKIMEWNESDKWALSFSDAHDLMQARDSSLPCSIKKSLSERLDLSKTFVLIVGGKTKDLTKGSCKYCQNYSSTLGKCIRSGYVDFRSFIRFECEKAAREARNGNMRIVVIYNSTKALTSLCPEAVQSMGTHLPGLRKDYSGKIVYDYQAIKSAIMSV